MVVGGVGAGAIQSYIKKEGVKEAKRIFTKTIKSKLIAWGADKLAVGIGIAVDFALGCASFGSGIAEWLDDNDDVPRSGYLDVIW